MTDVYSRFEQPYERNERVTIFWPNGPHDFVIEFHRAEPASMRDGWLYVRGLVVEPNTPQQRTTRDFFVHPVEGGYALVPHL